MRVLLTCGPGATSARSWDRFFGRGPRCGRARHRFLRGLHLHRVGSGDPDDSQGSARRHPGRPRGLRRGRPPGRALERSARRSQSGGDLRDQPPARRASPRRREPASRFVCSSSCSNYGPPATRWSTRFAAQPRDALRRVEGAGGAGHLRARGRRLQSRPSSARPRPMACRRATASTSSSTTSSPGP